MPNQWVTLALVAALSLAGCSSPMKRGQGYMEKEMYSNAVGEFEDAVKKDPKDVEAQAWLLKARQGWVSQQLIATRSARLAGNDLLALDLLLGVVKNEAKWEIPSASRSYFTQEEEMEYALRVARGRIQSDVRSQAPLRAQLFMDRYAPVFGGKWERDFGALRGEVTTAGKARCRDLAHDAGKNQPYYDLLVTRFCRHWGEERAARSQASGLSDVPYARDIAVSGAIEGASPGRLERIRAALQSAFRETAWFLASAGKSLTVSLAGDFSAQDEVSTIPQEHRYFEKVAYTDYEKETRYRTVPATEQRWVQDPLHPEQAHYETVSTTRQETYTEDVPVTRYRDEERSYRYLATLHRQFVAYKAVVSFELLGHPVSASYADQEQKESLEHHENLPSIGLSPAIPTLISAEDWYRARVDRTASELRQRLASAWRDNYCGEPASSAGRATLGNLAERCLRQKSDRYPKWVETWYQNQLGTSVSEAEGAIGRE